MSIESYRRFPFAGPEAKPLPPFGSLGDGATIEHDITVAPMHLDAFFIQLSLISLEAPREVCAAFIHNFHFLMTQASCAGAKLKSKQLVTPVNTQN